MKDINEIIKDAYEDTVIPEGLKPENVAERLRFEIDSDEKSVNNIGAKKMRRIVAACTAVAACFIVMFLSAKLLMSGVNNDSASIYSDYDMFVGRSDISDEAEMASGAEPSNGSSDNIYAESYKQIYDNIDKNLIMYDNSDIALENGMAESIEDSISMDSTTSDATGSATSPSGNFSDTNNQVDGVDEADIIKTDGKYIYILDYNNLIVRIVEANNGKLSDIASISKPNINKYVTDAERKKYDNSDYMPSEMYIHDNKLIVLGTLNMYANNSVKGLYEEKTYTTIVIYDVSDVNNPVCLDIIKQSGGYESSRLNGEYMYIFSRYYIWNNDIDKNKPEEYVPLVDDKVLNYDNIGIIDEEYFDSYFVVTSVNVKSGKMSDDYTFDEATAFCGFGSQYYISNDNIYFANTYDDTSRIVKINYNNGTIKYDNECVVDGYIDSQFSFDEYNGYLRLVTSEWKDETNNLFVIDKNMKIVGKIEKLAKGERIYSARFYSDYAYFVTYRETDPLFTADLSNPRDPKIVSEIKLPGFSDYLQKYNDNLLFGIGYQDNERRGTMLKLSMFDISDPCNVFEDDKVILGAYYYSSACDNHKALLIDEEKQIIGFDANGEVINKDREYEYDNYYVLYTYSEDGFEQLCTYSMTEAFNNNRYIENVRGMYIGDYLYIISMDIGICSYEIGKDEMIDKIEF